MSIIVESTTDRDIDVQLKRVRIDNEIFFKISNIQEMRPFLMSIVSHSDLWMFVSSNGGITAGRQNAEQALFPYYTDDKIIRSANTTGSKTIVRVAGADSDQYWEPMSERSIEVFNITRNIYKNRLGNKVRFEEINHDLNLHFHYDYNLSEKYGFIRQASIQNLGSESLRMTIMDGVQNVLPACVPSDLQVRLSNLVDAYKRSELIDESGLAVYALSAIIVDKAEPSEALKANTIWSYGVNNSQYLLSELQIRDFRKGMDVVSEQDIKGERGAYFNVFELYLSGGEEKHWGQVCDTNKNHTQVIQIRRDLKSMDTLVDELSSDVQRGSRELMKLCASSDAMQLTDDHLRDARHFSNTMFNIMRGGIFDYNYIINKDDFLDYLRNANLEIFEQYKEVFEKLGENFTLESIQGLSEGNYHPSLIRLTYEYLPLKFSRRHGDPSRPWNKFSINIRNEKDGSKILDYEGNWRDIFQNWEALATSYPNFLEGMIFKFLNATTFDGYNPYRVTKGGYDWEIIEPDDPWSYIGYWGDHQIIYLQKFLEQCNQYFPGRLRSYFDKDIFTYANVPYKIKPYQTILKNPKDTIDFDFDLDHKLRERRERIGVDGALLHSDDGNIYHVNFVEKILSLVLAKISNFIPDAGIWMNTQRPEWNDANNALVGNGVSMVTLYYLRRMLNFLLKEVAMTDITSIKISAELMDYYKSVRGVLSDNESMLESSIDDVTRKKLMDLLGEASSDYRVHVYKHGLWGKKRSVSMDGVKRLLQVAIKYLDASIQTNKRSDGMYHAYNLIHLSDSSASISRLNEMLEGQVSVLSSGYLSSDECLEVLDALKSSRMFRSDQYSFMLYPNKSLPGFLNKNNIPEKDVHDSEFLLKLLADGNTRVISKDLEGGYHFNSDFFNSGALSDRLDELKENPKYQAVITKEKDQILDLFEEVFDHKSFTGRSGTFFGYEGLGSIYWHMVSKLLLAVQECSLQAIRNDASPEIVGRLLEHYYEINEGIGVHKSPRLYGAFPTDAYSHTPFGKGAQQPGMTGQVKEDFLCRMGELGVFYKDGKIIFYPCLLRKNEFSSKSRAFTYYDVNQVRREMNIDLDQLCFTVCQIPVVYEIGEEYKIHLKFAKEGVEDVAINSNEVDINYSQMIFNRTGDIDCIVVKVKRKDLK